MIKSLPKSLRRNLVPAPDTAAKLAKQFLEENAQDGAFWPTVCDRMSKIAGEKISVDDFQIDKIPEHLRIRIEVVDEQGKVVEATREVQQLQGPSPVQAAIKSEAIDVSKQAWFRSEMRSFDIDQLPESVSVRHGGVNVIQYPTLKVDGDKVSTAIVDRLALAKIGLRRGILHLYSMIERRELRSQVTHLPQFSQSQLKLSSRLGSDRLRDGLCDLMARIAFVENQPEVRSRDDFELRRVDRIRRISVAAQDLAKWLPKLADHYQGIALQLEKSPATWSESKAAIKRQLTSLLSETFFVDVPWEWLKEYPRYLQAIGMRLERLKTIGPVKDMALEHDVNAHWQAYLSRAEAMGDEALLCEPLIEYRWMIEENRVSLFAQQLGTRVSVSPKRLEKIASAIG